VVGTLSTASLTYNDAGQLLTERYTAGPLAGVGVTNIFAQFLRRTNLLSIGVNTRYGYDNASRLCSVTESPNWARKV
jgi:hypothetical protein